MVTHPGPCLNYEGQDPSSYDEFDSCYLHIKASEQMASDLKAIIRVMHERIQRGGPSNYLDGDWYLTEEQRAIIRWILAS